MLFWVIKIIKIAKLSAYIKINKNIKLQLLILKKIHNILNIDENASNNLMFIIRWIERIEIKQVKINQFKVILNFKLKRIIYGIIFWKVAAIKNLSNLANKQKLINHKYIGGVPNFLKMITNIKWIQILGFIKIFTDKKKNNKIVEKNAWIKKYLTIDKKSLFENCHMIKLIRFNSIKIHVGIKDFIIKPKIKEKKIINFLK